MKKKTIIFSCLALVFLSSVPGCFADSFSTGIICLIICGVFIFLAIRSVNFVTNNAQKSYDISTHNVLPANKDAISTASNSEKINMEKPQSTPPIPIVDEDSLPTQKPFSKENESMDVLPPTTSNTTNISSNYEYVEVKVAGVTFKNEKGPSRQTLLKKIKNHTVPFDEYLDISINQYEYEGELAYSVCVNNRQIGNVPKSQVQYIHDNINRFVAITGINVYGGYRDENGYFKSYGAAITIKYLSENV